MEKVSELFCYKPSKVFMKATDFIYFILMVSRIDKMARKKTTNYISIATFHNFLDFRVWHVLTNPFAGQYKGYYVDVFGGGILMTREELERQSIPPEYLNAATSDEVYIRLLRNLIEEYNSTGEVQNLLMRGHFSFVHLECGQELTQMKFLCNCNISWRELDSPFTDNNIPGGKDVVCSQSVHIYFTTTRRTCLSNSYSFHIHGKDPKRCRR